MDNMENMENMENTELKEKLIEEAESFVASYGSNEGCSELWRTPVVGIAAADDPAFVQLKEEVIPGHFLPRELLASAQSVVAIFVPYTKRVIDSNTGGGYSSLLWDNAYKRTNEMLAALNEHLSAFLRVRGYEATNSLPTEGVAERAVTSRWSHRHIGVIAGVGTFGINNMIITRRGCAGRMITFVTEAFLPPDSPLAEQCLYKAKGTCRECVAACPMAAIKNNQKTYEVDKTKCVYMCYDKKRELAPDIEGGENCGKCSCGVACSYYDV